MRKTFFGILVGVALGSLGIVVAQTPTISAALRVNGQSDLRGSVVNGTGSVTVADDFVVDAGGGTDELTVGTGSISVAGGLAVDAGGGADELTVATDLTTVTNLTVTGTCTGCGGGGSITTGSFTATFQLTDGMNTDTQNVTVYYQVVGNMATLYLVDLVSLDTGVVDGDSFSVSGLAAAVTPDATRTAIPMAVGGDPFLSGTNIMPGQMTILSDGTASFTHATINSISDDGTPYTGAFTQYAELFPGWNVTYPLDSTP